MAKSKQRPKKHVQDTEIPKDTLTLKYWLFGALAVAAVVGVVFLISFLAGVPDNAIAFTYENGVLTRESDGRTYQKASAMYQVEAYTKQSEPRYGKAGDMSVYKVAYKNDYNVVVAMSEDNYLTDGRGTLYHSSDVSLPNLSMFDADEVSMGTVVDTDRGTTITYLKTLTNNNSPDATDFVEEYLACVPYTDGGDPQETCRLKLTSSVKYPWLALVMHLVRCDNDGENDFYVYTDENRQSVKVSSEWFGELWSNQNAEQTPDTTQTPSDTETPVTTD